MDTSQVFRAGWTRACRTPTRRWTSTPVCLAGSSRTRCLLARMASISSPGCTAANCRRRLDPGVGACDGCVGHIYLVGSADETASKVRAAGGGVVREPSDVMDAGRMALFTDPEGAAFCVWEAKEHKGARVVNEHGALNFNGLNTREVDGAKVFYGSVFGWKTMQLGGGVKRGRCRATETISSATTPAFACGSPSSAARSGSRTSSQASTRFRTISPTRPTLECDFRGRRRRRHGREGRRAWRNR